jgi:hypothetical protein
MESAASQFLALLILSAIGIAIRHAALCTIGFGSALSKLSTLIGQLGEKQANTYRICARADASADAKIKRPRPPLGTWDRGDWT